MTYWTLPAACPGYSVAETKTDQCWADITGTQYATRCREKVDPEDDLGLCAQHREEMVDA